MCCLRRRTLKLLNMLFLSFSPSGELQKEIAKYYSQWPCGYECFQWTALSLHNFWVNTVILPWVHVYSKGFFPIGFALHKLYSTCFTPATNIYTLQNVSSPTSLNDFKLLKRIYYVNLNVVLLYFLSKSAEKAIAPHSSTLAWKIPWMEEPGGLHSMGSLQSRLWLSDFTFTFHFHAMEKEMATHSSVLAWRIPGMGKPGGLPSMESHRVRHTWSNLAGKTLSGLLTEQDRKSVV